MKLSHNFTLAEFTSSPAAIRLSIDNSMIPEHIENAKALMEHVWQPVRDCFGVVTVNSGYRSPMLNKAVGGSTTSQHCTGEAMDGEVFGIANKALAQWIVFNCEFDQVILEFPSETDPSAGWVHASYSRNGKNRKEVLTAVKENGRTVYKKGIA